MIPLVACVLVVLASANAAPAPAAVPGSLLYPYVPASPHAYLVKPYAAAAPVLPLAAAPASYSHVSHTQYTSHPVPVHAAVVPAPAVYHTPLLYHAPHAVLV